MTEFTIILEEGDRNWSAYVPDLPGCVAAAATRDAAVQLMREAIALHLELMRESGEPIPEARSHAALVSVA
jgi:predicted RNase H-like HicB family nuclease